MMIFLEEWERMDKSYQLHFQRKIKYKKIKIRQFKKYFKLLNIYSKLNRFKPIKDLKNDLSIQEIFRDPKIIQILIFNKVI